MKRRKTSPLGTLLSNLRARKGVGIKTVAPHVGVSYTYLSKLENGHAQPSADVIRRLARYFSYDPDVLMMAAGRVPPETLDILQRNPDAAIAFLRERFAHAGRRDTATHRGPA